MLRVEGAVMEGSGQQLRLEPGLAVEEDRDLRPASGDIPQLLRSAVRFWVNSDVANYFLGFRLARTL